jgi:hypothetical protein
VLQELADVGESGCWQQILELGAFTVSVAQPHHEVHFHSVSIANILTRRQPDVWPPSSVASATPRGAAFSGVQFVNNAGRDAGVQHGAVQGGIRIHMGLNEHSKEFIGFTPMSLSPENSLGHVGERPTKLSASFLQQLSHAATKI